MMRYKIMDLQKNIYANDRTVLMDAVPLEMPLCISIEPSNICNFKCRMCFHGNNETADEAKPLQNMPSEIFEKTLSDIKDWVRKSGKRIKLMKLYSLGEPLLHPDVCEWVRKIKNAGICDSLEITTNASLLTESVAEKLVDYGLDTLRVSVYGVSEDEQKRVTQSAVSAESIRDNVIYLQEYKKKTDHKNPVVYAKMLDTHTDENQKFIDCYTGVADHVGIDEPFELTSGDNDIFDNLFGENEAGEAHSQSLNSNFFKKRRPCRYPFTHLTVRSDGKVVVCCADWLKETCYGNVMDHSLDELWNSRSLYDFRCRMLNYRGADISCCRGCEIPYRDTPEDDLSDFPVERLSYTNNF